VCVIVDADVACSVFGNPPHHDFLPVFEWLHDPRKGGHLVHGGRLTRELSGVEYVRRYLAALNRAGRASVIPEQEVTPEQERVAALGICRSGDVHIIALARISGARTLCSHDRDLHRDFTNPQLISKPKGSVYQNGNHTHLLRHTSACRGRLRRQVK
jgi:hypothetical protein